MIQNAACPWLPHVENPLGPEVTRRHGKDRGEAFYQDALRYSQSMWIQGKPAQALLQLNKAWMSDLTDDEVLEKFPPPYQAMCWLMHAAAGGSAGYLGNPVRHFQHLASRMSGPRAELRSWRAWLCFHLAGRVLPEVGFPRDWEQMAREGLWIPSLAQVLDRLGRMGWPGEARIAARVLERVGADGRP